MNALPSIKAHPISFFRLFFGFYLMILFLKLIQATDVLFGSQAVGKTLLKGHYDSKLLISIYDLPDWFFIGLPYLGLILTFFIVLLSVGKLTKRSISLQLSPAVYFILWLILALFFVRQPLVRSVHIDYIGWLLMLNVYISPNQERIDLYVGRTAWIFFSILYFLSGINKIQNSFWLSGESAFEILQTELSRFSISTELLFQFKPLLRAGTWAVVFIETFFFLGLFWPRLGKSFLFLSFAMHTSILIFLRVQDLTLGILLFHLFLYLSLSKMPKKGR